MTSGQIVLLDDDVDAAYVKAVCALSLSSERGTKALYTPLHGVGETSVFRVVQQSGFRDVSIFEPQRSQDGAFPNVPDHLPNPERFAVFGPAIEEAKRIDVDLVLASDPDADRMAVAVRDQTGEFVCLSGNQLGALLTDYVLVRRVASGSVSSDHFVIETLVTPPPHSDDRSQIWCGSCPRCPGLASSTLRLRSMPAGPTASCLRPKSPSVSWRETTAATRTPPSEPCTSWNWPLN